MNFLKKALLALALFAFGNTAHAAYTTINLGAVAPAPVQISGTAVTASFMMSNSAAIPVTKIDLDNNTVKFAIALNREYLLASRVQDIAVLDLVLEVQTADMDAAPSLALMYANTNYSTGAQTATTITTAASGTCTAVVGNKVCTLTVSNMRAKAMAANGVYYLIITLDGAANSDVYFRGLRVQGG